MAFEHNTPSSRHVPVLCDAVLRILPPRPDATIVDATVGMGGHSAALLDHLPAGRLIALDHDPNSVALAQQQLQPSSNRVIVQHANFATLPAVLQVLGIQRVDGILADLGCSSWQLAQPEHGLSFQVDGPLDMRMDPTAHTHTAAALLRRLSLSELTDIFRRYGEERYAARIARAIVSTRRDHPLRTTRELADLIVDTVPSAARRHALHPATRIFQALRIVINRELEMLQSLLDSIPDLLAIGGRLVIISFHSLEDRMVKRAMRAWAQAGTVQLITRRPIVATAEEVARNPRARSAKLRACEWTGARTCA